MSTSMTKFEHNLPASNFKDAGRNAFNMGFTIGSNPYTGKHNSLWRTGYRAAEFEAGGKGVPRLRKSYSFVELDEVECDNCQDVLLEGQNCEHCNPSTVGEITII